MRGVARARMASRGGGKRRRGLACDAWGWHVGALRRRDHSGGEISGGALTGEEEQRRYLAACLASLRGPEKEKGGAKGGARRSTGVQRRRG